MFLTILGHQMIRMWNNYFPQDPRGDDNTSFSVNYKGTLKHSSPAVSFPHSSLVLGEHNPYFPFTLSLVSSINGKGC